MPRTQKKDGSWEAIEFGSGNAECGNWKMKSKGKDRKREALECGIWN
ncbi:MAG: hypothetical protein GY774_32925 [Planctomycetes bacterium]|nr:hypothetical protein [Planctomycetota bacterium]